MKQHPVPQHIASYQFHLIGQMTLKQFLELTAGIIIAWLIYSLHLPGLFKWPLVLISGLGGAMLAFLPIEERPLDIWITNFIKSIYSPTQYIWKKQEPLPTFFIKKTSSVSSFLKQKTTVSLKKNKSNLKEYLATLTPTPTFNPLDLKEKEQLEKIARLLGSFSPSTPSLKTEPVSFSPPLSLKTKVRKLGPKTNIPVPLVSPIKIKKQVKLKPAVPVGQSAIKLEIKPAPPLTPPILVQSRFPHKLKPAVAAQFSTTLPIPNTPHVPNLVVGMVLNDINKIVPNALIEIINEKGETVRALKTNKLGQFFSASALKKGQYQLKTEHPDFQFDIMEFKAENKIIKPFKIKAKKRIV